MSERAREALWGAVDLHCHSAPNPIPRIFDHVEAARDAGRLGMQAILVKSHHHNTVMDIQAMAPQLKDIETKVYGGVALNDQVGGINPYAVEMCLRMGGRAVWFPTLSSCRHIEHVKNGGRFPQANIEITSTQISPRDDGGELTDDTHHVLDLIVEQDALLSAGHLPPEDIGPLFAEASQRGIERMIISHPNNRVMRLSIDDARPFVELGGYLEHEISMYDPQVERVQSTPEVLMEWVTQIGPERTVLASDLGQLGRPLPVDAYLRVGEALLELGLPAQDLRRIAVDNPAFLLGIA